MSMFSIFRPAPAPAPEPPFSMSALQEKWTDPPRFLGKKKVDPPAATWLAAVAAGCRAHDVPRAHWPAVAKALMAEKALLRVTEFESVLSRMEGRADDAEYVWTWERFEVAVESMGWSISRKKTHAFTVALKKCGQWWVIGKKDKTRTARVSPLAAQGQDDEEFVFVKPAEHPKAASEPAMAEASKDDLAAKSHTTKVRKTPIRAMSDTFASAFRSFPGSFDEPSTALIATTTTDVTTTNVANTSTALVPSPPIAPPAPRRAQTEPVLTTVTHAPDWLVSAVGALDFLTSTHPTAMSALSAVLLTVGSVPAIAATSGAAVFPALAATAGGHAVLGVLGSGTAQAVGAVVMGLGNWIKVVNEGQVQVSR